MTLLIHVVIEIALQSTFNSMGNLNNEIHENRYSKNMDESTVYLFKNHDFVPNHNQLTLTLAYSTEGFRLLFFPTLPGICLHKTSFLLIC